MTWSCDSFHMLGIVDYWPAFSLQPLHSCHGDTSRIDVIYVVLDTRPKQNGSHFADDIFKALERKISYLDWYFTEVYKQVLIIMFRLKASIFVNCPGTTGYIFLCLASDANYPRDIISLSYLVKHGRLFYVLTNWGLMMSYVDIDLVQHCLR